MTSYRACIRRVFSSLLLCAAFIAVSGNAFAYCAARGTISSYEWINSVSVAGAVKTSGNNGGYASFPQPVINLTATPNAIALTPGYREGSYTLYWKIWIDYNRDDNFGTDEVAFSGAGSGTVHWNITLPQTATNGETGMRIAVKYGATPASACGSYTYGEVEDYRVSIDTADITPPAVVSKTPAAAAVDVPLTTAINAGFSENLQPSSVTDASVSLSANGLAVDGTVGLNGKTVVFTPAQTLAYSTEYRVTVHAGISDLAGNAMRQDVSWSFTTVSPDLTSPEVVEKFPRNGEINVHHQQAIQAVFSEPLDPQTVNSSTVLVYEEGFADAIEGNVLLSGNGRVVQFYPAEAFKPLTAYTVKLHGGIQDLSGNAFDDISWSFTSNESPPFFCQAFTFNYSTMWIAGVQVGPVSHSTPAKPAAGYSDHTSTAFQLEGPGVKSITLTPGYVAPTTVYWRVSIDWNQNGIFSTDESVFTGTGSAPLSGTITVPPHALPGNARMRVNLRNATYPSACGTPNYGEVEDYTVTLFPVADNNPPDLVAVTPAVNAPQAHAASAIRADFSEAIDLATVSDLSFTLSGANGPVPALVSYDALNMRAVLTPAAALDYSTVYTARLSGLKDLSGNPLADHSWAFTTESNPGPGPVYEVSGHVREGGVFIAGVTVNLMDANKTFTTVTDTDGAFSFPSVPPGLYQLVPSEYGFEFTPASYEIDVLDDHVHGIPFDVAIRPRPGVNGDFETGDFSGFAVSQTTSAYVAKNVVLFDTDNDGVPGKAAKLNVGNNGTNAGQQHGVILTQNLTFPRSGDLSVTMDIAGTAVTDGTGCLVQVYFGGTLVASHDFGAMSAGVNEYRALSFYRPVISAGGTYALRIHLTRPATTSSVACYLDDLVLTGSSLQN